MTRSRSGGEQNDDVGRLRLVGHEAGAVCIAPVRKLDDLAGSNGLAGRLDRLDDVESVAGDKEGVIAERVIELRDHRMIIRDSLRFELFNVFSTNAGVNFMASP